MARRFWIIILIGFLCFKIQVIYSCEYLYISYGDVTNLDYEIESSNFILTARITERLDSAYRIKINRVWKGDTNGISILTTGTGGIDCGMLFKIGVEYLIYGKSENGNIYTNCCSRTIELSRTGDIDFLDNHFFNTKYDTLIFTSNELNYIKLNLIHSDYDSLLNPNTNLIFYNNRLITKDGLIGINPNALSVEYRYFSLSERKHIKSEILENSMNGILILYDEYYHKQIKSNKLIKKDIEAKNSW